MRRTLVPALLLVLASLAFAAQAAPTIKPTVKTDVARAAARRIEAAKIPTLAAHLKPLARSVDGLLPKLQTSDPAPADPPASTEPALSAEELALDVVEITPGRLGTPQVGVWIHGTIETWGVASNRAFWVPDVEHVVFSPVVPWIAGRALLVECRGKFAEPSKVTYSRWSYAKYAMEELGSLVVDIAGDDQLSFVVPPAPLEGWERLWIRIEDADGAGAWLKFERCTFTRL